MFKKSNILLIIVIFFSFSFKKSTLSDSYIYPTYSTSISSYFGYRQIFGSTSFHNGIDFPVAKGTHVYATAPGIVSNTSFLNGYGNSIIIQHFDGNKSLYAHLDEVFIVQNGQEILQGELIGYVGPKYLSNGNLNGLTTGPHLHFTIFNKYGEAINPLDLGLKKDGRF